MNRRMQILEEIHCLTMELYLIEQQEDLLMDELLIDCDITTTPPPPVQPRRRIISTRSTRELDSQIFEFFDT